MTLQSLTSEGVAAKTAELYELTDAALAEQAASIGQDFRLWVAGNFILSAQEQNYLTALNNVLVTQLESRLPLYLIHRVPITFTRQLPSPPPVVGLPPRKWLSFEDSTIISTTEDTGSPVLHVDGSVAISIVYCLLINKDNLGGDIALPGTCLSQLSGFLVFNFLFVSYFFCG